MTEVEAVMAAIAAACWVAVWAMSPSKGDRSRNRKAYPHEVGAPGRGRR